MQSIVNTNENLWIEGSSPLLGKILWAIFFTFLGGAGWGGYFEQLLEGEGHFEQSSNISQTFAIIKIT